MRTGRARSLRALQITDGAALALPSLLQRIQRVAALPEHARRAFAVELRDPTLSTRALLAQGAALREATRAQGAALLVNDRVDLALLLEADGVHLGRRSMRVAEARELLGPSVFISVACHDLDDVTRAAAAGADAVKLSPIFASPGKGPPLGLEALSAARRALESEGNGHVALWALGGIHVGNASLCLAAGADGVASIRADPSTFLADLAT